jgi:hypothetical protein
MYAFRRHQADVPMDMLLSTVFVLLLPIVPDLDLWMDRLSIV